MDMEICGFGELSIIYPESEKDDLGSIFRRLQ